MVSMLSRLALLHLLFVQSALQEQFISSLYALDTLGCHNVHIDELFW